MSTPLANPRRTRIMSLPSRDEQEGTEPREENSAAVPAPRDEDGSAT